MLSLAVLGLSKRLGQVSLSQQFAKSRVASPPLIVRSFAAKPVDKKKKNLESKTRKRKELGENVQHEEWVKFQQSISIAGFETGQTTTMQSGIGQKRRGGKNVRKRLMAKSGGPPKLSIAQQDFQLGGGEYPPLRYSEEETNRLLEEAYASIPERAGKRGTRNLRRQSNRWEVVRRARNLSKTNYGIRTHERRMAHRSRLATEVREVKQDAPSVRERDTAYQQYVLEKWTNIMFDEQEEKDSA